MEQIDSTRSVQADPIKETIRTYLLDEFLPNEDSSALTDSTPLITGGILDSISTVKLWLFLEQQYGIEFQAHEMNADLFNTVDDIAATVRTKIAEPT